MLKTFFMLTGFGRRIFRALFRVTMYMVIANIILLLALFAISPKKGPAGNAAEKLGKAFHVEAIADAMPGMSGAGN